MPSFNAELEKSQESSEGTLSLTSDPDLECSSSSNPNIKQFLHHRQSSITESFSTIKSFAGTYLIFKLILHRSVMPSNLLMVHTLYHFKKGLIK